MIMIMMKLPYIGKRLNDPIMDNLGNLRISQEKGGSAQKGAVLFDVFSLKIFFHPVGERVIVFNATFNYI